MDQLLLAGATEATAIRGELELLSLSPDGTHLHLASADSRDAMIGGHLLSRVKPVGRLASNKLAGAGQHHQLAQMLRFGCGDL